eukprot:TRINITY_DN8509_c0_g1::TRINITY_DN8509_c0_g1_i1::g.3465::m.3465 TRINITY_DN8509_c0_g1::TRINITY_DN8509_c0_g1_i1::g.3465  ORF type:complete len:307 (-),score=122.65,BESS/PF02944.15/2.9e+02,BESS/PF02944.15/13,BESS/PF02944.15/7.2e+02 TRINITY_DN8509_c0_g1_i1:236-1156(-)
MSVEFLSGHLNTATEACGTYLRIRANVSFTKQLILQLELRNRSWFTEQPLEFRADVETYDIKQKAWTKVWVSQPVVVLMKAWYNQLFGGETHYCFRTEKLPIRDEDFAKIMTFGQRITVRVKRVDTQEEILKARSPSEMMVHSPLTQLMSVVGNREVGDLFSTWLVLSKADYSGDVLAPFIRQMTDDTKERLSNGPSADHDQLKKAIPEFGKQMEKLMPELRELAKSKNNSRGVLDAVKKYLANPACEHVVDLISYLRISNALVFVAMPAHVEDPTRTAIENLKKQGWTEEVLAAHLIANGSLPSN